MEYVQERVATLHAYDDPDPPAPTGRAAVVVPMTAAACGTDAAEGVLAAAGAIDPATVVVPLRAAPDEIHECRDWLAGLDVATTPLWCNGPGVTQLLADRGLDAESDTADASSENGKGRDVWLALGVAADRADYVAVHDADVRTCRPAHFRRLLAPLGSGERDDPSGRDYSFVKGYYARVEDDRLYGRLFRLLYAPLVRALADRHDAPVVRYLAAFRYALAGEFAATADLARSLRAQRGWGLEVGTLGDAFAHAGFEGSAQVDLGVHRHDHKAVGGSDGLAVMSETVAGALFRVLADHGVEPDYDALRDAYRSAAEALVESYAADAAFNGLDHDAAAEREQVAAYAEAIRPPGPDCRLPAWCDASLSAEAVVEASRADVAGVREG